MLLHQSVQESKLHLYVITDSQLASLHAKAAVPNKATGLFLFLYDTPFSTTGLASLAIQWTY